MKNNNENEHNVFTIPCIGIDGLIHECEPQSDTAICGCIVVKKKVGKYDYKKVVFVDCYCKIIYNSILQGNVFKSERRVS